MPDNTTKVLSTNNIFPAGNKLYFLLDSVIGTGNTICSAISFLIDKGALEDEIVVASILSSYDGVSNILSLYNDVSIFSCYLNNQLFIDASQVPKNNDIGEKIFGI